jgi:CDP-diacylglycerol--glycerol-3-phosphate 3-phosphatidyltransferase
VHVPLNAPNVLTILRVLLIPMMVVALLARSEAGDLLAAAVFAIASVTDGLDGWLARSRGEVTDFGKMMDPLADKLLIIAALVTLVWLDRLALWVAAVIIIREVAVTIGRARADGVVPAAGWGKLKTGVQVAAILALVAFNPSPAWVDALVYVAVAVTIISGVDFFWNLRHRQEPAEERPAASSHSRIEV